MKVRFSFFPGIACAALLCLLAPSALRADNLIANGGFEGGTYSSTLGGNTNTSVPVDWTPDAGFDLAPSWNHVDSFVPHTGTYDLAIGNDDGYLVPSLSQTFSDISGDTYSGSIWVLYGGAGTSDTVPFFDLSIGLNDLVALNYQAAGTWTDYTFSFIGTGSDTLTIEGNTTPSEWYVDDVTVNGPGVGGTVTPEPSTLLLLGTGLLGFAGAIRRKLAR